MDSIGLPPPSTVAEDQIDVADILRSVGRQWRKIAIVTLIVTGFAVHSVLVSVPQFTVTGSVYLGDLTGQSNAAGALSPGLNFITDFQSVEDVDTQVALIQSTSLLKQAILETGLNASIVPEHRPNLNFWRWRYLHRQAIDAFAPQPGDLRVLDGTIADPGLDGIGYEVVFGNDGHYTVQAPGNMGTGSTTILTGIIDQPASGGGLAFIIKPAIDGSVPPAGSKYIMSITQAKSLARAFQGPPLSVAAGGTDTSETNMANLIFTWDNPFQAQQFLTQLMTDFIATQLEWKTQSASATESFIADELNKVNASLTDANRDLASYQSRTGIIDVPANADAVISKLSSYEEQEASVELQQEALQQLAVSMKQGGAGLNPFLVSQSADTSISSLAADLANDEAQVRAGRIQYTGNAPQIQALNAQIGEIENSIATIVSNDEVVAAHAVSNLKAQIANYKNEIKDTPSEGLQVLTLTQSSQVYGQLYVMLMQKEEEAEVSKAATIVDTRIVSPAEIPLNATTPKPTTTIMGGLFVGLFAGIGLVLAQRAISGTFQSDDDLRRSVHFPVYGLIPRLSRREAARGVLSNRPQSPFSEAFRLLRSNLYQSASGRQSKVILITSATSGDGKTTVGTNLAKFLADDGKKIVLIDGDLHRGRAHEALKINQTPGLTEWIVTTERPPLQPVEGQGFVVLTTGTLPPNPSELLNEPILTEILDNLRAEFDYVIVDCPPLPAVSDTITFGHNADLILSVVLIDHTSRRAFGLHNETIAALDGRRGLIINGVVGSVYGYGYSYDGYGYGYGGAPKSRSAIGRSRQAVINLVKRFT